MQLFNYLTKSWPSLFTNPFQIGFVTCLPVKYMLMMSISVPRAKTKIFVLIVVTKNIVSASNSSKGDNPLLIYTHQ
jgi:hypothetical protein